MTTVSGESPPFPPPFDPASGSAWAGEATRSPLNGFNPNSKFFGAVRLFLPALWLALDARAAVVAFAADDYTVTAGTVVSLPVVIEYAAGDPAGLFSFGVRMLSGSLNLVSLHEITVPEELAHNSILGPGAAISLDDWGVKGSVIVFGNPLQPYAGELLATFNVSFDTPGNYGLSLDFFNTLGPTEEIFVSGDGIPLDASISFRGARVTVVPEPTSVTLLGGAALWFLATSRRRERRTL